MFFMYYTRISWKSSQHHTLIQKQLQASSPPMDRDRYNLVFLEPGSVLVNCEGSPLESQQSGVPIEGMNMDNVFELGRLVPGAVLGGVFESSRADESSRDPWAEINFKGDTGVFWDVVDFPVPAECDPDLVSKKIKSALDEQGCCNGSVSIRLYEDEKTFLLPTTKQELIDKYEAAGVSFNFVPEVAEAHGYARDHKMLVDILRWAVDSPKKSNLIVLSNNLDKDSCIRGLRRTGRNNVALVEQMDTFYCKLSMALG